MAISPTSDLILDVARAADPVKAQATTRALAAGASGVEPIAEFSRTLDRVATAPAAPLQDYSYHNPTASIQSSAETKAHKAAVGLESVLLKSFVDQMLPKDAVNVFGGGVAGDVWKSMLSEKIANEVAKSGSLKLASRLFETHPDLLHSGKHHDLAHDLAKVSPAAPAPNKI
jgi:flagellar protein FlgJ